MPALRRSAPPRRGHGESLVAAFGVAVADRDLHQQLAEHARSLGVAKAVDRLRRMEAVFISLMALVVLLTGYVALLVLYRLFKSEN